MIAFAESYKGFDKFGVRALKILETHEITELEQLKKARLEVVRGQVGAMSAGLDGFLSTMVEDYQEKHAAPPKGGADTQVDRYQRSVCEEERAHWQAMAATFGKPEKEKQKVHIDLGATVPKLSLTTLPQTCWPQSALVDALAQEAKNRTHEGRVPFVYQQVEKYLPSWCKLVGAEVVVEEDPETEKLGRGFEALAKKLGAEDKKQRKLDPVRWLVAFDRYALAAAATGQLTLGAAMAHKDTCLRLGAVVGQRLLGVTYDELVRRSWAERSVCGDVNFDIEEAALAEDAVCVKEARAALEPVGAQGAAPGNNRQAATGSGQAFAGAASRGKGGLTCFKCGKEGHKARECTEEPVKGSGKQAKGGGRKRDYTGKPVHRGA